MSSKTELHLQNCDCVAGMQRLADQSIDICVTSPPYNLGIKYGRYCDTNSTADYLKWTREWVGEVHRLLSDNGSFFLNFGSSPSNPTLPYELVTELRKLFVLQNTIHWIKSISLETRDGELVSAGHFKPINSERFITDCHEFIFHLTKAGRTTLDRLAVGVPYVHKSNIRRWSHTEGRDKRCRGNVWFIPYETIHNRNDQRPHPASFPKELPKMCIQLHGRRDGLVMIDPFLGIGNSALAAVECRISRFVGFELDPVYLEEASARLDAQQAQLNLLPP